MIVNRFSPSFLLIALLSALAACAPKNALIGDPQAPYPPSSPPEVGQIIHLPTGIQVTEEQMLDNISCNRIVYVGETHDNPASHRLELTVLKAMAERHPGRVALGMEMLTPAQDEVLRRWVAGELSEKEFLKQADWYTVWKDDFDYFRDLLEYARDERIPVIGLNADKKTVRLVVASDPRDLAPEERANIPELDLDDPYQRGLVEGIYGGHIKSEGMLEGFHRAQTLWDETMAESVVRFLKSPGNEDVRMVVIAGGNHVRHGFGIPRRVFRRLPVSYALVGSREIEIPQSKKGNLMDVTLPRFPMPPYDYLVLTRYEELESDGVKLGVMMGDEDGEVIVKKVLPGSNAERAGIREGDVILTVDGEPIRENIDLVYAIKRKIKGDRGIVGIRRDGEDLTVDVTFEPTEEPHHAEPRE